MQVDGEPRRIFPEGLSQDVGFQFISPATIMELPGAP
jgi:hypothetical protein